MNKNKNLKLKYISTDNIKKVYINKLIAWASSTF